MPTHQSSNHAKISPTAKLVAYWRQFTDLPFSQDIASLFQVEDTLRQTFGTDFSSWHEQEALIPLVEVRYRCIQNFIAKKELKQVLEFASGISLRGLAMTEDPTLTYVETDLPEITMEKLASVQTIMQRHGLSARDNLFFHTVNVLNFSEIEPSLVHFSPQKPLAIVHEGLFQYLSKDEKKIAAQNIHKILAQFGGYWITPDLDTKQAISQYVHSHDKYQHMLESIYQATNRHFLHNAFADDEEVFSFFTRLGFKVGYESQFEGDHLNLEKLKARLPQELFANLKNLRLWILTLA